MKLTWCKADEFQSSLEIVLSEVLSLLIKQIISSLSLQEFSFLNLH